MNLLDALDAAAEEFRRRLVLVGGSDWARSTPCPAWDVRYLTAHVVGGNRFAVSILGGMSAVDAIDAITSAPQLGDNALDAWGTTTAAQSTAFRIGGALERQVDHPLGQVTGRALLEFRVFDLTLHAWDLARAIGADERIEPELVQAVLAIVANGPPGMGFGITALGVAHRGSPPQASLLDLTGRPT